MGAACFTAWADGYTRGEKVMNSNPLESGKKYIVYCYNTETPAKSGYWTESSTGSYLIMAPHADDTEFSERFVWTVEKKDSYWIFTNEATGKKPLEASNPTGYNAAMLGSTGTVAELYIPNASTGDYNAVAHWNASNKKFSLFTSVDNNYGVNTSEGFVVAHSTATSGTNKLILNIFNAEQPITNPLQVKLNELIKTIVADNNPNELQETLTRARAVQDATLADVEALLAPYLIYKGENTARLQKPEATEPNAYGSVYMPFSMKVPEGVSAYAAVAEGDELKLTKVGVGGSTIPAGAYILWSSSVSGEVTMAKAETDVPALEVANELTGTIVDDIALPEGSNYVLSKGSQGVGFYKYSSTTYPAKRAVYAAGTASSTSRFFFSFDDVVTALSLLPATTEPTTVSYDLQGRKQSAPRSGFSIKGGRKNIIR